MPEGKESELLTVGWLVKENVCVFCFFSKNLESKVLLLLFVTRVGDAYVESAIPIDSSRRSLLIKKYFVAPALTTRGSYFGRDVPGTSKHISRTGDDARLILRLVFAQIHTSKMA